MTTEDKKKIALAQKARWAKVRKEANVEPAVPGESRQDRDGSEGCQGHASQQREQDPSLKVRRFPGSASDSPISTIHPEAVLLDRHAVHVVQEWRPTKDPGMPW
jgi:hypothetical protein